MNRNPYDEEPSSALVLLFVAAVLAILAMELLGFY